MRIAWLNGNLILEPKDDLERKALTDLYMNLEIGWPPPPPNSDAADGLKEVQSPKI